MNSNPTSKILSAKTVIGSQAAPKVAAFSSKGPNVLTPEILKVSDRKLMSDLRLFRALS